MTRSAESPSRVRPPTQLVRFSEARLPTPYGDFRLVVYRAEGEPADTPADRHEEHVAMVRGEVRGATAVLARVHSSCFTGEVLGSLRCDCREQLDRALERIAEVGCGVVVYLVQEGRGIGLGNKVRAYALQDQGVDTVDANLALGFDADPRSYDLAAQILAELGVASVRLMTNNPEKIRGLEGAGVAVAAQESHWVGANAHSAAYLEVKQTRMGHLAETGASAAATPGAPAAIPGAGAAHRKDDQKR